jgi:hypothetical protein
MSLHGQKEVITNENYVLRVAEGGPGYVWSTVSHKSWYSHGTWWINQPNLFKPCNGYLDHPFLKISVLALVL